MNPSSTNSLKTSLQYTTQLNTKLSNVMSSIAEKTSLLKNKLKTLVDPIIKIAGRIFAIIVPATKILNLVRVAVFLGYGLIKLKNTLQGFGQKNYTSTFSFKDKISGGIKSIKDKYLNLDTLIKGGKWLFNATLGSALKQNPDSGAAKSWNSIGGGVKNIKENLKNAFTQIGTKNLGKLEEILKRVQKYVLKLEKFTGGAGFQKFIDAGAAALGALLDAAVKVIGYVEPMITPFINAIMAQMPQIKAGLGAVLDWLGPKLLWIANQIPILQKMWTQAWPVISSALSTAWSVIKPALDVLFSAIVILWGLFQKAWPHMLTIVKAVWAGLKPICKLIADALKGIQKGLSWVAKKLGIELPESKPNKSTKKPPPKTAGQQLVSPVSKTKGKPSANNSFLKTLGNSVTSKSFLPTNSNIINMTTKRNERYPQITPNNELGINKYTTEHRQETRNKTSAKSTDTLVIREEALVNRIVKAVTPVAGPVNMTFHIHEPNMTVEQLTKVLVPKIKLALANK